MESIGNRGVALNTFTDGTSTTLLVGEKHVPLGTFGQGALDSSMYNGDTQSAARPAGPMYPLAVSPTDYGWKFGSYHPGICQFAFVDGHVRTIVNTIDVVTLGRLADRADGNPVGDFD